MLFLPAYSSNLNPMENFLSKLKAHLKAAEERTLDGLWSRIGTVLDEASPQECRNFLRNDG
jgi:transposase